MASPVGNGPITVDAYIDFLCPFCRQLEERSRSLLGRYVSDHVITLVYYPPRVPGPAVQALRLRVARGGLCVRRRHVLAVQGCAVRQPARGGRSRPRRRELVELGRSVGIDDLRFADNVFSGTYLPWAAFVTELAIERGIGGTPAVLVAGRPVPANPQTIAAAVADLGADARCPPPDLAP